MPATRSVVCILFGLVACVSCFAQTRPCLSSTLGDGHPLFGAILSPLDDETFLGTATSVVVGDFDDDGIPDVAVTFRNRNVVAVAFGKGDGRFGMPAYYPTQGRPMMLVARDLTGNQKPDIAAINQNDNSVTVLLNHGDGTFAAGVHYPVGPLPRSIAAGDVSGSGLADLIVLNHGDQTLSVLRNLAGGAYAPEIRINPGGLTPALTGDAPGPHVVLGDFNQSGHLDIVVPRYNQIMIMLNDGAGNFAAGPTASLNSGNAYAMVAADFNNNQYLDLAVTTTFPNDRTVHVLLNAGNGTFHPALSYEASPSPYPFLPAYFFPVHITAADLDGNGAMDLVVGDQVPSGFSVILRNRGDGTFHPKQTFASDSRAPALALDDLNGDGYPDWLIVAAQGRTTARVLLNDRTGRPMAANTYATFSMECCYGRDMPVAADLNGNGKVDLAMASTYRSYQLIVSRNEGGTFVDLPPISLGPQSQSRAESLVVTDLNGNGIPDIVVTDSVDSGGWLTPGKLHVLFGLGNHQYAPPVTYDLPGIPRGVTSADLNGNQHADLAVWTSDLWPGHEHVPIGRQILVFLNDGTGTFQPADSYHLDNLPYDPIGGVAAADVDGSGRVDLIAAWGHRSDPVGRVGILRNLGNGQFAPPLVVDVAPTPAAILTGSLKGNQSPDLVVVHATAPAHQDPSLTPHVTVLRNDGQGGFSIGQEIVDSVSLGGFHPALGDLNGNGLLDLVVPEGVRRGFAVHLNNGNGTFAPAQRYAGTNTANGRGVAIADFNGDGRNDVAMTQGSPIHFSVLYNAACPQVPSCYPDCDGDGILNINDFLCFIDAFAQSDPYADCDDNGLFNMDDFLCFIDEFAQGCP